MIIRLLFTIPLLILSQSFFCQDLTAKKIIEKSAAKLKSEISFSYKSNYRIKRFDDNDTSAAQEYTCHISKAPNDTILGYFAHLSSGDNTGTTERIYNGSDFLMIFHSEKRCLLDKPNVNGKNFIQNNIHSEHIPRFLISKDPLIHLLQETKLKLLGEVNFKKQACWKIEAEFEPDDEITSYKKIIYIIKKTMIPCRIESYASYKNLQQEYQELSLFNIKFSPKTDPALKKSFTLPENYRLDTNNPASYECSYLDSNSVFPEFEIKITDNKVIRIDSLQNEKLLLLDFWYLGCASCIKAIPELKKLDSLFKENGLKIIGLNPIDDFKKRENDIRDFSEKLKIKYQLSSIQLTTAQQCKVNCYPTTYLISKGKIIYSSAGFSVNEFKRLELIIRSALKFK